MIHDPWYFLPSEQRARHLTELASSALEAWGGAKHEPELFLEGENAVFRAELRAHGTCAVRVHRAYYHTPEHMHSQVAWCRALTRDGVARTATIIDTDDGQPFVVHAHPDVPEPRFVSVLTWEPGRTLRDVAGSPAETFETLGSLLAKVNLHGQTWSERDSFVGMLWDADSFLGENAVLGPFWDTPLLDGDDRRLMDAFRAHARRALDDHGYGPSRFGIVHGDLLPQNLLLHDDQITLLDFDDCGHGWYLMEIATALMAASFGPDYLACRDALLAGYRRHLDLDPGDLELLPMLIALRTATYVGWVKTHPFTPAATQRGAAITRNGVLAVSRYLAGDGVPA